MVKEKNKEIFYFSFFRICMFFSLFILGFILLYVIINGYKVINFKFLTTMWNHQDITQGGIFPAIFGSILLGIGISIISIPIGICTAIYLSEYAKENYFTNMI